MPEIEQNYWIQPCYDSVLIQDPVLEFRSFLINSSGLTLNKRINPQREGLLIVPTLAFLRA